MHRIFFYFVLLVALINLSESSSCNKIFENSVSRADQEIIVNEHNRLRNLIKQGKVPGQPRGINLKTIKYDKSLANEAQRVSNSCEFQHKIVGDGRWYHVGQNLYISMSTGHEAGANWPQAIQAWFDEYKDYSYGQKFSPSTGHYTQMVWANTDHVGCGYTYYASDRGYKYNKLYTCNYGPGGNIIGKLPYESG